MPYLRLNGSQELSNALGTQRLSNLSAMYLARTQTKCSVTVHYYQMIGLLQEFQAKYVAKQSNKPHFKEFHMGDKYITPGQAAAVGPGAQAHHVNFAQVWNQVEGKIPLNELGPQLERLRNAMK
jgi:hypothetical protein